MIFFVAFILRKLLIWAATLSDGDDNDEDGDDDDDDGEGEDVGADSLSAQHLWNVGVEGSRADAVDLGAIASLEVGHHACVSIVNEI